LDEDTKLVNEFLSGNDTAFDLIISKYSKMIFRLCWRFTGNRETAEDLTQTVFMKVFRHLKSFKKESSFKTWVYAIALNETRAYRRKNRYEFVEDEGLNLEAKSSDPESPFANKEEKKLLNEALEILPFKQKAVITLRINEELPFREIARALNISENSAKVNFQHGFNSLKEIIERKL
jgi:RNA polymerase sigma-70 factor (ECF subfamily)